ncbi:MAG: hypothetical protein QM234_02320, partial [Acidobacteriota bacterium]|nr:hypothetical protein [Acidobacteriota bacterium]
QKDRTRTFKHGSPDLKTDNLGQISLTRVQLIETPKIGVNISKVGMSVEGTSIFCVANCAKLRIRSALSINFLALMTKSRDLPYAIVIDSTE